MNLRMRELKSFSFNQILNNLIILKQEINCRTNVIPEFVPQAHFTIGEVISINNSTNLKHLKT